MKRRTGFVANSSSSSFVVALPRKMKLELATLQQSLYGPADLNFSAQIYGRTEKFASSQITARILPQLQKQKPNSASAIEIYGRFSPGAPVEPPVEPLSNPTSDPAWLIKLSRSWAAYNKACLAYGRAQLPKLTEEGNDSVLYIFEFDDFDLDDPLSDFICNDPRAFARVPHWRLRWG
jgi:hypothetical protein